MIGFQVNPPMGQTVTVSVVGASSGVAVQMYYDEAATVTTPSSVAITEPQVFYLADGGVYGVSMQIGGTEYGNSAGTPQVVTLSASSTPILTPVYVTQTIKNAVLTGVPTAPTVAHASTRAQVATIHDTDQVVNVAAFATAGNGVANDAPAIQAAINACPVGGVVYFPSPAVTYGIGATLVLPAGGNITLQGPNGRLQDYTGGTGQVITQLAGANLDACIAEYYWYNNNGSTISAGIQIRDLSVNTNTANQSSGLGHGFAGKMWRSQITYNAFLNARNDAIVVSLTTRNGSTVDSTNHCIENIIENNSLVGFLGGGIVFNGANVTDHFVRDNIINGVAGSSGIVGLNNAGAGMLISGNHIYVCDNGINFGNVSLIRIVDNYIEQSSAVASSGTVYQIAFSPVGPSCICNNNIVKVQTTTQSGTTFVGIGVVNVVGSATESAITICGNVVQGGSSSSDMLLYVIPRPRPGYSLSPVTVSSRLIVPFPFHNQFPALLFTEAGPAFTVGAPTTTTAGFAKLPTCAGAPTGVPADLTQGIPVMYDTTNHKLWVYDTAWKGVVLS